MKTTLCLIALTVVAVGVTGCSRKLSPELRGLALTKAEARNNHRVNSTQLRRMGSDDLARLFFTDNPSRLSPYPVVYTGGMPR